VPWEPGAPAAPECATVGALAAVASRGRVAGLRSTGAPVVAFGCNWLAAPVSGEAFAVGVARASTSVDVAWLVDAASLVGVPSAPGEAVVTVTPPSAADGCVASVVTAVGASAPADVVVVIGPAAVTTCPSPPARSSAAAVAVHAPSITAVRTAMGSGPRTANPRHADARCRYVATNLQPEVGRRRCVLLLLPRVSVRRWSRQTLAVAAALGKRSAPRTLRTTRRATRTGSSSRLLDFRLGTDRHASCRLRPGRGARAKPIVLGECCSASVAKRGVAPRSRCAR
jgi:hypothetical protein